MILVVVHQPNNIYWTACGQSFNCIVERHIYHISVPNALQKYKNRKQNAFSREECNCTQTKLGAADAGADEQLSSCAVVQLYSCAVEQPDSAPRAMQCSTNPTNADPPPRFNRLLLLIDRLLVGGTAKEKCILKTAGSPGPHQDQATGPWSPPP